jgi:uncharacterized membrane protein
VIEDPLAIVVLLAVVVWVSLKLEERSPLVRSLGAALVGILLGMLLSNTGVIPGLSPAYDFLQGTGVSIGIVLILLGVDVRSVLDAGPTMLVAFFLGALGTAVGAMAAAFLLAPEIGGETWKLAGQFTGTYIGGGMNFAALGQAFETSGSLFTAAIAADVVITAIWMAACLTVPVVLGRGRGGEPTVPSEAASGGSETMTLERRLYSSGGPVALSDAAALVAIALGAVLLSRLLGAFLPVLPEVLWLTTLALAAGQLKPVQRLSGSAMLGNYLVLLFLASNGAQSVIANIVRVGPAVFYFACVTVGIHGALLFGLGRLFRFDLGTLAVASQANIGGAASAMAMASARGYTDRLLPGVAVGLLGYAIGNYAGFAVAALMRAWLVG